MVIIGGVGGVADGEFHEHVLFGVGAAEAFEVYYQDWRRFVQLNLF